MSPTHARIGATDDLERVVGALARWQQPGAPFQLHPGDIGWHWRLGGQATAEVLWLWEADDELVAVGFRDGPTLMRLALAHRAMGDATLAQRIIADLEGSSIRSVEAPQTSALFGALVKAGWERGESWTPLERDLSAPVETPQLEIVVVDHTTAPLRVAVQRAAFEGSTFTVEKWQQMASGTPYASARCLLGVDAGGIAVAAATVWSAGDGRYGLIEPLGVHEAHRGKGYGKAITLACAAALRELGSSVALVATPTVNLGGVATYASAGFVARGPVHDLTYPG